MRFAPGNNGVMSMRARDRSRALCSEHKGLASQYARRNNLSPRAGPRILTCFGRRGSNWGAPHQVFATSDVRPAQGTFTYYALRAR